MWGNWRLQLIFCKDCPFAKRVWELIKQWFGSSNLNSINVTGSLHSFWRKCCVPRSKEGILTGSSFISSETSRKRGIEEPSITKICSQEK
jgi:hypothetical protein